MHYIVQNVIVFVRMRYMSHFRAIHRGSFFQEMRTTEVRALLPDAWGFVCPVHTPDGSPCGLLNHLSMPVELVTHFLDNSQAKFSFTILNIYIYIYTYITYNAGKLDHNI